jgi:topoisomerase-4 subunit A
MIELLPGISPDKTIDALYALTDCEYSISPNTCVIFSNKPSFMGVTDILKHSVDQTVAMLKAELHIRKGELEESWHMSSLEKIFIEEKIYRDIEECETWESVIDAIDEGLKPFKSRLFREVTREDIVQLTEIRIKRISKFDVKKADEFIKGLEAELEEVKNHIKNLIPYTINYFRQIKKKYGKGRERKTELRSFDTIEASKVVANNAKLYVNWKEGFIGTGLKKDEFVCDCSDLDDILVIRKDGVYMITKVDDKIFVGNDIIHVQIFLKNDERTIYNIVYQDYLTRETAGSKIIYFSANPNGEAEVIKVHHKPRARLKKLVFEFDFGQLAIKGKSSMGNILTRNPVAKISLKEKGLSTLGGRKIWFDDAVFRLNVDGRGLFLGEFSADDKILVITKDGFFRTTGFDLTNHFEDNILIIEKFKPSKVYSVVYWDSTQNFYYVKRFMIEDSEKPQCFINEEPGSKLISLTEVEYPRFEIVFGGKNKDRDNEIIEVAEFIGVKSFKAKGKRLSSYMVENIQEIEPVVKSEVTVIEEKKIDEEPLKPEIHIDPAQMKLEL